MRDKVTVFRLYTETLPSLDYIVPAYFDGFSMITGLGFWKGKAENCTIIEIITNNRATIANLVNDIKISNRQESVMVLEFPALVTF